LNTSPHAALGHFAVTVAAATVLLIIIITRGSAMAEGPRDSLSVKFCNYKTSHLKTRFPGLSCGIICRRTDRHTTTACTTLSIASRGKKLTDGAYALVYRNYMVNRRRRDKHGGPSSILLIPASSVWRRNFSKSTVAQTKMGHVRKTTPFLAMICHTFGKT